VDECHSSYTKIDLEPNKFKNHRLKPVNIIIPMKKTTIVLGLLATLALASCAKRNQCPAYGRTSIDNPAAVKGRG
jgi:hypothetical protein